MNRNRKRKVIRNIPKKKRMPEPPPRKRPLWLKCLYFAIAFLFMVSLGLLLYFSTLPPEYDRETMGNIVSHELTYSTSQGRTGGRVFYHYIISFQYMVAGKHYSNQASLSYTRQNFPFIQKIKDYGYMYPVKVTYDSHNPQKSTIVVE